MIKEHVIALCQSFDAANLAFWVDGGWGVDALLGQQTRPHSDLDLAVNYDDLPSFQVLLESVGYTRLLCSGNATWNWVFRHARGQSVDLHGFVPDSYGNGILGDPDNDEMYDAEALNGIGRIGDVKVRCIAAAFVLRFRNGFEPRKVDYHDVNALCVHFGLELPSRFLA